MPKRRTPGRTIAATAATLVAVVLVFFAGKLSAPADTAVRVSAGVPVGYARSEAGARAAALQYGATRARAILLPPAQRRAALQAIGTPRWAALAEQQDAARDLAPLAGEEQAQYLATGVGAKLTAYSGERATVVAWLFQAFAGSSTAASWQTQVIDLVWQDEDWKIDGQRAAKQQAVPRVAQTPRMADTRNVMDGLSAPVFGRP